MLNSVQLFGRLTRDPELKMVGNDNVALVNFTVAVDRRFKNKTTGDREADFINCVAWRQTAEFIAKYFTKGKPIVVVGSLQTRSWENDAGEKRYATEVSVDQASFTINDSKASEPSALKDESVADLPFDI